MPIIRFHRKEAPADTTETQRVTDEQLRVLLLFNATKETAPPCTARKLAHAASVFEKKVVVVLDVDPVLRKLIKDGLVTRGPSPEGAHVARADCVTFDVTFDELKVLSDRRGS